MRDPCRYYLLQRAATTYLFEAEHERGVESCAACSSTVSCARVPALPGAANAICAACGAAPERVQNRNHGPVLAAR